MMTDKEYIALECKCIDDAITAAAQKDRKNEELQRKAAVVMHSYVESLVTDFDRQQAEEQLTAGRRSIC